MRDLMVSALNRFDHLGLMRGGAVMGVIRIANMAIGMILAVVLTRALGVEGYGVYIFALGWVYIVGMPTQLGLPTLVMRQVAVYRGQQDYPRLRGIMRWSVGFVVTTSLAIGIVGAICWLFVASGDAQPAGPPALYLAGFALILLLGLMGLVQAMLAGFERVQIANLPDTLIRPALLIAAVVAAPLFVDLTPALVMALHAGASFVAIVWAALVIRRGRPRDPEAGDSGATKYETTSWLTSLWPMTLLSGAAVINARLDVAMLGLMSGPESVALYDVGLRLAGLLLMSQAIFNALVAPKVARLYASGSKEELQALLINACRLSFLGSATAFLVIWLFGAPLMKLLFGQDFASSYTVALIASVGYLYNVGVGAVALILNMTGHERTTAAIIASSAVLNAVLNAVLIPRYGADGAAAATSVSTIIAQTLLWHRVRSLTGLRADVLVFFARLPKLSTRHTS